MAGVVTSTPILEIAKSVVAADAVVDGSDIITYEIRVTNLGSFSAFDVAVTDTLPADLAAVGAPNITDGDGTSISSSGDLFAGTLVIDSVGGMSVDGTDEIVITYSAVISDTVEAGTALRNGATLDSFASSAGGPSFLEAPDEVGVTQIVSEFGVTKSITAISGQGGSVGDIVTYEVVVTVPEGRHDPVVLEDVLDTGLVYAGGDSVTLDGVTVSGSVTAAPTGTGVSWSFGEVDNPDDDDATPETLTVVYDARIANLGAAQAGVGLDNTVTIGHDGGTSDTASEQVTVLEPLLTMTATPDDLAADAGDVVSFQVCVAHSAATPDAFDVQYDLTLPTNLSKLAGFAVDSGPNPVVVVDDGTTLSLTWSSLTAAEESCVSFTATVGVGAPAGGTLQLDGTATWTSQPGLDSRRAHRCRGARRLCGVRPCLGAGGPRGLDQAAHHGHRRGRGRSGHVPPDVHRPRGQCLLGDDRGRASRRVAVRVRRVVHRRRGSDLWRGNVRVAGADGLGGRSHGHLVTGQPGEHGGQRRRRRDLAAGRGRGGRQRAGDAAWRHPGQCGLAQWLRRVQPPRRGSRADPAVGHRRLP